jgi:uncharacterized protein (TIGR03435 family)
MNRSFALFAFAATAAFAQPAANPAFEVVSIKPAAPPKMGPGGGVMMMRGCNRPNPGTYRCTNGTLRMLLTQAYNVKNYQVEGPAWLDSEAFDIDAKIPEGGDKDFNLMLQNMLAERFQVKLHKENKPLPVYELAVAKGGFKLKEVDPEELKKEADAQAAAREANGGRPVLPPPPPPPPGGGGGGQQMMMIMSGGPGAGGLAGGHGGPGAGPGGPPAGTGARMTMSGDGSTTVSGKMTVTQLVNMLGRAVDRPILDTTDLKGVYDISLTYLADRGQMMADMHMAAGMAAGMAGGGGDSTRQADASSPIATVFQSIKTLGLTLEPKKSPFEVFIIDGATKTPTEN